MGKKNAATGSLLNDYHLLSFDQLDSTNDEARRIAGSGRGHGAVIWAKRQTEGRGRMGRVWISSDGNLFVSILLQPRKPLPVLPQLSFVASLSIAEAIAPLLPATEKLQCKWPNDLVLGGRKLGGVLLESFQAGESAEPWAVAGVGVNVDSFPPRTPFPATCLKEAGVELISAKIVLSRFIHHFVERYNEWNAKGFAGIRKAWLARAWGVGERMHAVLPDRKVEGILRGIDKDGSLLVDAGEGREVSIRAADIFPTDMEEARAG